MYLLRFSNSTLIFKRAASLVYFPLKYILNTYKLKRRSNETRTPTLYLHGDYLDVPLGYYSVRISDTQIIRLIRSFRYDHCYSGLFP